MRRAVLGCLSLILVCGAGLTLGSVPAVAATPQVTIQPAQSVGPDVAAGQTVSEVHIPIDAAAGQDTKYWYINICEGERLRAVNIRFDTGAGRLEFLTTSVTPTPTGIDLIFTPTPSWAPGPHTLTTLVYDASITGYESVVHEPYPSPNCNTTSPGLTSATSTVDIRWVGAVKIRNQSATYGKPTSLRGTVGVYGNFHQSNTNADKFEAIETPTRYSWRYKAAGAGWSKTKSGLSDDDGTFMATVPTQTRPFTVEAWVQDSQFLINPGDATRTTQRVVVWVGVHIRTPANWTVDQPTPVLVSTSAGAQASGYCILESRYLGGYTPTRFGERLVNGVARFVLVAPDSITYQLAADCTVRGYPSRHATATVEAFG